SRPSRRRWASTGGDCGSNSGRVPRDERAPPRHGGGGGGRGGANPRYGPAPATQGGAQAGDIELRRRKIAAQMVAFGLVHGRIEIDQDLPSLDALPVADVDGPDDAGFERLDDFGAPTRDDFSRRRGDDVDLAKRRPGQGQAKQRNDRHTNGPPDRRGRRLDDFQRRRQKRELMLVTAICSRRKRDDVLGGALRHSAKAPL